MKKIISSICIIGIGLIPATNASNIVDANDIKKTARTIMEEVDHTAWEATDNAVSRIRLTSCKFGIESGSLKCSEPPRIKVIDSIQKHFGEDGRDNKSLMIVREPGGERGVRTHKRSIR